MAYLVKLCCTTMFALVSANIVVGKNSCVSESPVLKLQTREAVGQPITGLLLPASLTHTAGLVFKSNDELVVWAETRSDSISLAERNKPRDSDRFRLSAAIYKANGGQVVRKLSWPTRLRSSYLWRRFDGGLIVRAGDSLKSYGPDLTLEAEFALPITERYQRWRIHVSLSGRTVLAVDQRPPSRKPDVAYVLDAATLTSRYSWRDPHVGNELAISDTEVVRTQDGLLERLAFGRAVWSVMPKVDGIRCYAPEVVGSNFLINVCGGLQVLDAEQHIILKMPLVDPIASASQNSNLIAGTIVTNSPDWFDTGGKQTAACVMALNVKKTSIVVQASILPVPKSNIDVALSPDGRTLAVYVDTQVYIHSLSSA